MTFGKVAEPHRATLLSLSRADGKALSSDADTAAAPTSCAWAAAFVSGGGVYDELPANLATPASAWSASGTIISASTSTSSSSTAAANYEATLTFPAPGKYRITAQCSFAASAATSSEAPLSVGKSTIAKSTSSVSEEVTVAYIRRELRQLTKKDKDAYLDTFLVLHQTSTSSGRQTYGPHYQSLTDLQLLHLSAATDRREDHLHDGMGFLTQHVAMTMAFELSLQTVHPHLSVPYW